VRVSDRTTGTTLVQLTAVSTAIGDGPSRRGGDVLDTHMSEILHEHKK